MDNVAVGRFNNSVENPRTNVDWICSDPKVIDAYVDDPMCGYSYSALFYKQLSRAGLDANDPKRVARFPKVPTLIISGEEDAAGGLGEGVKEIAEGYRANGVDITLKLLKDMRHEVLNELHKEDAYAEVLQFLERQLQKA